MDRYPWYELVAADAVVEQGDLVRACPILVPVGIELDVEQLEGDLIRYDVVIMSQSCDLRFGKAQLVAVCPVFPLAEIAEKTPYFGTKEGRESLRRGYNPGYHLLNRSELLEIAHGFLVADFSQVFGVPFEWFGRFVKENGERLRLLPPYREHLAQAFARFFMRVGLPLDIPSLR